MEELLEKDKLTKDEIEKLKSMFSKASPENKIRIQNKLKKENYCSVCSKKEKFLNSSGSISNIVLFIIIFIVLIVIVYDQINKYFNVAGMVKKIFS